MSVRRSLATLFALFGLSLCAPAGALHAQVMVPSSKGTLIEIPYRTYVAIDPLGIPFDIFSAELENAVAPGITLGGAGSYTDLDHDRYTSADLKFRYYPGEVVLRGFAIGASVGYLHYRRSEPLDVGTPAGEPTNPTLDAPTIGVLVDYNWLLGTRRRFFLGTGLGAKRILAGEAERQAVDLDRAYLTARFVLGIAF
jgi:hypothetical protein